MLDAQRLRKSVDGGFDETNTVPLPPDADDLQAAGLGGRDNRIRSLVIDIDHRRGAWLDQFSKQPQLGGQISVELG